MDQYIYKGIPLTPSIAREHILKYERLHLSSAPFKRSELVTYAAEQHQSGGGIIKGDPTGSVKKATLSDGIPHLKKKEDQIQ